MGSLSQREHDVLQGILRALTDKEIAVALNLQHGTIKVHVKGLLRKLGARSRLDAAILVLRAAMRLPCPRCGYEDIGHDGSGKLVDDVGDCVSHPAGRPPEGRGDSLDFGLDHRSRPGAE